MESTVIMDTVHLKQLTPQALMDVLNNCFYPELFDQLSHIATLLERFKNDELGLVLSPLLQKISTELDYLQSKEKIVLYPYLLNLHNECRIAESLKPFEIAKAHYLHMLALLQQFYLSVKLAPQNSSTKTIFALAQNFEKDATKMQDLKHEYLFSKFIEGNE
jgi:iron-sulfur cluster repair protein YtfE (RIC family)